MSEKNETKGKPPKFKGCGIDIWVNTDKNGNAYLTVQLFGSLRVNCFKYVPKEKEVDLVDKIIG